MPYNAVSFSLAILAVAGMLFLAWMVVMAVAGRVSPEVAETLDRLRARYGRYALAGAFTVALVATAGSLYFSEIAKFEPCRLCWYQRIAMYPLVPILAIALARRDTGVRVYAIPLATIGAVIAGYHVFLEWFPQVDAGACTVGVPCTLVWFRELGFVSIPVLSFVAFLLVIALLAVPPRWRADASAEED